ncbi:MAG: hypothetical protein ACHQNT_04285 [Bacteroidia bacterium]
MRQHIVFLFLSLFISGCDCIQEATGVVLDKETEQPIAKVALGKYEKEDANNSYSRRTYTGEKGNFSYHGISGGLRHCPDLELYFSKEGYETIKMTFESISENDTVLLERAIFNSAKWLKEDFKGRSKMVESLLAMKDSLLINKTPVEIEHLLGKPDERTNSFMTYFFEKKYGDDIVILSHVIVSFDTLQNICVESWWTD